MSTNARKFRLALTTLTLVALMLSVFGAVPALAASTYYVATTGSDSTGDGTQGNPWATIGYAIGQASNGDTINVVDGTYTITSKILVDKGVTITGNTSHPENVVVQYATLSSSLIFDMRGSNATIQGIKTTNGKSGFWFNQPGVTGCTISHCIVDNVGEYGIYMKNGGSGHTISDNVISNTGQTYAGAPAVLVENCLDVTVSGNTLSSISDKGIYVRVCNATNAAQRVEVTGNTLSGCAYSCIQVYQSPYTYVYSNTISSTSDKGINIIGPNASSQTARVIVEGNNISGCPWGGILLTHDRYTYIYNNTISSTGDKGISIANGENVTSSAERIIVEGNNVSGTKWPGIQVAYAVSYTYIHDNTLSGCNYYGADGSGDWDYASIHVAENCDNTVVDSNDVSDGINGIQIWSDNCTVTNNVVYDMGKTYADTKATADGTYYNSGIIVGSNWLTNNFKPTGTTITGNSIHDNYYGLYVRDYANQSPGDPITLNVTAEENYWGAASGPGPVGPGSGDNVSTNVDYSPWWASEDGTATGTELVDQGNPTGNGTALQTAIGGASAGDVIVLAEGAEYCGVTVGTAGVTILGQEGSVIKSCSHGVVINANDVTLDGITYDGTGCSAGNDGIHVNDGIQNLWIRNCEVKYWCDNGVEFAGAITGLKIVDNYIHHNTDDGIEFNATPGGTVQIYGNAFRSNTVYGINNGGASSVTAEYNEWGDIGGPTTGSGDGVNGSVDYTPWVFGKLYVDPASQNVRETEQATVYVKMDVHHLYGIQFDMTFDHTLLQLNAEPTIGAFNTGTTGSSCTVTDKATANSSGTISFNCNRADTDAEYDATDDPILTLVFDAQDISGTDATSAIDIDASSVVLGAKGGVNIFVDSVTDGEVKVLGTSTVSGVVDLQGRDDDSGAVVDPQAGTAYHSDPAAYTTAAWGTYSFSDMTDDQYIFTVEMPRYLDASRTVNVQGETLDLGTVVLLGGDCNDDETIDTLDATILGPAFGSSTGGSGWDPDADINDDGKVNILDAVLLGGNWHKSSIVDVPWPAP